MLKQWLKNGQPQKGAGPRRNPKLSKTPPWGPRSGPQAGVLLSLGFFLGRLPFGGDHFLTTFLAYGLPRHKTIILKFWGFLGFGQSRGHVLYKLEIQTALSLLYITFRYTICFQTKSDPPLTLRAIAPPPPQRSLFSILTNRATPRDASCPATAT